MRKTIVCSVVAILGVVSLVALADEGAAGPMIDNTHDRVQTTLKPGLKRIGTIRPRGAKEVGR